MRIKILVMASVIGLLAASFGFAQVNPFQPEHTILSPRHLRRQLRLALQKRERVLAPKP
jgi:hypothetical protein